MKKRFNYILLLVILFFTNNLFSLSQANNFVLQQKIDRAYVQNNVAHQVYTSPAGFAIVHLKPELNPPDFNPGDAMIYMMDWTADRFLYNLSQTSYQSYGFQGIGNGQFIHPWDVAATTN